MSISVTIYQELLFWQTVISLSNSYKMQAELEIVYIFLSLKIIYKEW